VCLAMQGWLNADENKGYQIIESLGYVRVLSIQCSGDQFYSVWKKFWLL
jgi:hypothetical protein